MDLGTIYRKFREKKYKYVESILNDIQMVWDNCKLYNSKASVMLCSYRRSTSWLTNWNSTSAR